MQPNRMPWLLMMTTLRRAAVYTYDNTLIFTSAMAKKSFIMPMPNMKNYTRNSHIQYEQMQHNAFLRVFYPTVFGLEHCITKRMRSSLIYFRQSIDDYKCFCGREQTCIQNSQIFFTNYSMHFIISVVLCLLNTQSLNDPMREAHTRNRIVCFGVCVCVRSLPFSHLTKCIQH